MHNKRIENIRQRMRTENADAFIIKNQNNLFYLSGFKSSFGYVYITQEEALFLTDFRYLEPAKDQIGDHLAVTEVERKPIAEGLRKFIGQHKTLAFESNDVSYTEYESLQKHLSDLVEFIPAKGWVEEFRKIKEQPEIDQIAAAQKIAEKALAETLNFLKPGVAEKKIARIIENFLYDFGAEGLAFPTIVVSGQRASLPHGVPSEKEIAKGELVTIDLGCKYNGYCSDMTRTFAIGSIEEKQRKIYNVVLEAQKNAIAEIMAGKMAADIDQISRKYIAEAGYGSYFGHGLGHSLGIEVHEAPALSPSSEEMIKENMVVTVEPGIYIPGFTGVRIEDLLVVKENGYLNLTEMNKELIIL